MPIMVLSWIVIVLYGDIGVSYIVVLINLVSLADGARTSYLQGDNYFFIPFFVFLDIGQIFIVMV
jgi:hypothetical protein